MTDDGDEAKPEEEELRQLSVDVCCDDDSFIQQGDKDKIHYLCVFVGEKHTALTYECMSLFFTLLQ